MFAVCQERVFEIEFDETSTTPYDGGSNAEIVHEDPDSLVNPIPDFVSYTRYVLHLTAEF